MKNFNYLWHFWVEKWWSNIDGWVQNCSISIANALEILQPCTKPSKPCFFYASFNSLWPCDAIWRQRSWSTLVQVMACCLMAPSHCLNQCWLCQIFQGPTRKWRVQISEVVSSSPQWQRAEKTAGWQALIFPDMMAVMEPISTHGTDNVPAAYQQAEVDLSSGGQTGLIIMWSVVSKTLRIDIP